jgi:DNA-binding MarR family transcriptional regulator
MNIGILLRSPFHILVEEIHSKLALHGYPEIRPAHGNVFQFIGKNGARVTDMAEKAQMTKQSMSYLVYYLESYGYVERREDPTDKRALIFGLTEKGKKVEDVAEMAIAEVEQKWEKALGKKDFKKLNSLLKKLNIAAKEI